ncbi:MATE efflux family protein [Rhizoctonia solani]|uniref:MATE efflux family protein n=1 Tax=Rhizoctonia solani TaxID=456999 RepID=A0A8H7IBR5_9AGAM|nr:MATE efflux family protein [Rhizoctonia solani]
MLIGSTLPRHGIPSTTSVFKSLANYSDLGYPALARLQANGVLGNVALAASQYVPYTMCHSIPWLTKGDTRRLGPIPLAAQSVLLTSANVVFMAPFSVSLATSIRVGNALGSGQKAKLAAETAIGMSVFIAMLISATYMAFRKKWGYMFNDDQEVVNLVAHVLPFLALSQLFDCGTTIMDGVLRARGKLAFGPSHSGGISLAFWANFGLAGLWMGLSAAMFCSAIVSIAAVCVTDWDREVAKTRARLGQSDDDTGITV